MEKFLKYLMLMLVATFSLTFVSCGDDDDEPTYDESNPIVGTWIVQEVSNPYYTNYYGGLLNDEEEWKANFIKEWTGKKLTFKASQIEGDVVWIQKFNEENPSTDRNVSYEIVSANKDELVAYYEELVYDMTRKDRFCKTTARMVMKRK